MIARCILKHFENHRKLIRVCNSESIWYETYINEYRVQIFCYQNSINEVHDRARCFIVTAARRTIFTAVAMAPRQTVLRCVPAVFWREKCRTTVVLVLDRVTKGRRYRWRISRRDRQSTWSSRTWPTVCPKAEREVSFGMKVNEVITCAIPRGKLIPVLAYCTLLHYH